MTPASSPIDPLYWFKNAPKDVTILVESYDNKLVELPKHYKFRVKDVSKSKEVTAFCKMAGGAFCEVVGGDNCGFSFYLSENGISLMERVEG
jgi:hypothetical protein